jgi:SAM-dependent methyltransferase
MLNGWLSGDDLLLLRQKGIPVIARGLLRLPLPPGLKAIRAAALVSDPPRHWWDIPAVRRRWRAKVTGSADCSFSEYFLSRYPAPPGGWTALSLGCGLGDKEREWAASGAFARLEAWDRSRPRIDTASALARSSHLDATLQFKVADAFRDPLPSNAYDLVLFEQSLHHFAPVRTILDRVHDTLRPGGLLFVNEFVGPPRFQWTISQRRATDELLRQLPARYRRLGGGRGTKHRSCRPSKLLMLLSDPSEAADSASILPAIRKRFHILEEHPYGGAVLQLLFESIAHNFLKDDAETRGWLGRCFAAEDALMERGDIPSDFAVVVARKEWKAQIF